MSKKTLGIMALMFCCFWGCATPTATGYYEQGRAKDRLSDNKGAVEKYNKAIELNPKYAEAYIKRGYAKSELKDYTGAMQDYNKAIELDPKNARAYVSRGAIFQSYIEG